MINLQQNNFNTNQFSQDYTYLDNINKQSLINHSNQLNHQTMSNKSDDEPIALSPIDKNMNFKIKKEHDGSRSKIENDLIHPQTKVNDKLQNLNLSESSKDAESKIDKVANDIHCIDQNNEKTNFNNQSKKPNFTRDNKSI